MSYPTISVSLSEDRTEKLIKLIRLLRDQDETISRSETVGKAIDHYYGCLFSTENAVELVEASRD